MNYTLGIFEPRDNLRMFTLNNKSGNSAKPYHDTLTYKLVELDSKKNHTGKEWDKVDRLNGKIGDLDEDALLLPISIQRMTKSVDEIIYARLKKQKTVTIPYVVEQVQIPETTARRALKRLEKSGRIKSRYEMRKVDDGVFHKHHVFYV